MNFETLEKIDGGEQQQPSQPQPQVAPKRARLSKGIPTDRIAFSKQLEILRAYGAAYDKTNAPVSNGDVSDFVGMSPSTISQSNAFFNEVGFIQKAEGGKYIPAPEVIGFFKAFTFNQNVEKSALKLSPIVERSWFGQEIIPKLKFRAIDEGEAVEQFAEVATAEPYHMQQLKMLLDYLLIVGLIQRDGTQIKLATTLDQQQRESASQPPTTAPSAPQHALPEGTHPYVLPLPNNRKVVVHAPLDITAGEIKRLQKWIEFTLQVDWSGDKE
jgi:hypothetical protein